jgi:hypothetical protein
LTPNREFVLHNSEFMLPNSEPAFRICRSLAAQIDHPG